MKEEEDSNELINPRNEWKAGVDPGFPKSGEGWQLPIILQIFCRKLRENERILTKNGACVPSTPLDPLLVRVFF